MTQDEQLSALETLNRSLCLIRALGRLPEQTEFTVMRAALAKQSANEACDVLRAWMMTQDVIEGMKRLRVR